MGWKTNPLIQQAINQFQGTQAAAPTGGQEGFWTNYLENPSLSAPFYGAEIAKAGEAGRAINEGAGIDPHLAAAGGGEQWALTNADKSAARTRVGNQFTGGVARTTGAAVGEGGRYQLGRAAETNRFNIGKAGEEAHALAGGSKYVQSPWFGVLQSLVGGAMSGIGSRGGSGADGAEADPGLDPGYDWEGTGTYG